MSIFYGAQMGPAVYVLLSLNVYYAKSPVSESDAMTP